MNALILALFGWQRQTVDGTEVWMHVSGIVVYQQKPE